MADERYVPGMLVRHPSKDRKWGLGKVLEVADNKVTVHFKDDDQDTRKIVTDKVPLEVCEGETDPALENLPPFRDGRFDVTSAKVTFSAGVDRFNEIFPRGFKDPDYAERERDYKWDAHQRYQELLGEGKGEALLAGNEIDELVSRACAVVIHGQMNLVSHFEVMALKDGLSGDSSLARNFFGRLFDLIGRGGPEHEAMERLAHALLQLPVEPGKARVGTWPVLTILPFLASPDRFMFLKPEPTKACAERMRFELQYSADLRWITYSKLMVMSRDLLRRLKDRGAKDFIDVQSFMWVVAKY